MIKRELGLCNIISLHDRWSKVIIGKGSSMG
jgi:hypothetical protein